MMSVKFSARSIRVLAAGVAAAWAVSISPGVAQASGYSSVSDCLNGNLSYPWEVEQEADENRLGECQPATSGLFPIFNNNLIMPLLNMLNGYFGNNAVGGPVSAFRERRIGDASGQAIEQLAHAISGDPIHPAVGGPGMAAGYTPTETTGEWIQRHLQPLRDHHVNTWFNTTWSSPRDDHRPTRYDSDIWTVTVGADMPILNESLLFGVFGSYTHSDVDTTFNRGGVESKLGTIGPYFMYTLNQYLAFDMTVAGVFGKHDNIVGPSPKARGDQETDGFFVSMNANANYWVGNYGVQGRVGFLHSDMETDSYSLRSGGAAARIPGTNNELTQVSVATQFNYFYDQGLPYFEEVMAMPYLRFTFNYDLDHDNIQLPFGVSQHPNDDDEVVIAWGVSLFGNGPVSGSVESGYTAGRSDFEAWTVSGTLNYAF